MKPLKKPNITVKTACTLQKDKTANAACDIRLTVVSDKDRERYRVPSYGYII